MPELPLTPSGNVISDEELRQNVEVVQHLLLKARCEWTRCAGPAGHSCISCGSLQSITEVGGAMLTRCCLWPFQFVSFATEQAQCRWNGKLTGFFVGDLSVERMLTAWQGDGKAVRSLINDGGNSGEMPREDRRLTREQTWLS